MKAYSPDRAGHVGKGSRRLARKSVRAVIRTAIRRALATR